MDSRTSRHTAAWVALMSNESLIRTGDIWYAVLDPIRGREQGGYRPVVVVSADWFHDVSGAELLLCVPLTTRDRQYATHVAIQPPEGGIREPSWAMCEQMRATSRERFRKRLGQVDQLTVERIRTIVRQLMTD